MRILHTSDWHLGMPLKQGTMADDQRFFLAQLCRIIREEAVDAVICAGDVYDSSVANAEAIGLYNEAVTTICRDLGKPMIVIAGNHDSAARLSACSELLRAAGLYVFGRLEREVRPVDLGGAVIYPIPFFSKDAVSALYPEAREQIHSQQDAAQIVCDRIRERMDPARVNIAAAHAFIVDAELSESDRAAQVGQASAISADVFAGFDYVALGHIHKPQRISPTVRYSGTPIAYSFGKEEAQVKQVVIFDTETKEQKAVPLAQLHPRRSLRGTYAEISRMDGLEDCYLNLTVTDRIAGLELLAELQGKFPFLLELHGMSAEAGGAETSISVDELRQMREEDILNLFLKEQYDGYEPGPAQTELFRRVLAQVMEGGDGV